MFKIFLAISCVGMFCSLLSSCHQYSSKVVCQSGTLTPFFQRSTISTNGATACAVRNGQVGNNASGASINAPVDVYGLSSGVQLISAGARHTCASVSGNLKCWGDNSGGALGDGQACGVSTSLSGISRVTAGSSSSCAISSGSAYCWGANTRGQLGDGTTTQRNTPTQVSGLTSGATGITLGYDSTGVFAYGCAVVNGGAKCWGDNNHGQLGISTSTSSSLTPVDVTNLGAGSGVIEVTISVNWVTAPQSTAISL